MIKINPAGAEETIEVRLSQDKTPVAWEAKVQELIKNGMSREDAEQAASQPFELELYYQADWGLFAVESESLECGDVISPYNGEPLVQPEDIPMPQPLEKKARARETVLKNILKEVLEYTEKPGMPIYARELSMSSIPLSEDPFDANIDIMLYSVRVEEDPNGAQHPVFRGYSCASDPADFPTDDISVDTLEQICELIIEAALPF